MAYSLESKQIMKDRCDWVSELSETNHRPMNCSHLSHDKSLDTYDDPDFGLFLTDIEHLAMHMIFHDHSEEILGLPRHQNAWSIRKLHSEAKRISELKGETDQEFEAMLEKAKNYLYYYFGFFPEES